MRHTGDGPAVFGESELPVAADQRRAVRFQFGCGVQRIDHGRIARIALDIIEVRIAGFHHGATFLRFGPNMRRSRQFCQARLRRPSLQTPLVRPVAKKNPILPPRTPIRGPRVARHGLACGSWRGPGTPLRSVRGGNRGSVGVWGTTRRAFARGPFDKLGAGSRSPALSGCLRSQPQHSGPKAPDRPRGRGRPGAGPRPARSARCGRSPAHRRGSPS